MALSEHERRALEEIETALSSESPNLADHLLNDHPGWLARRREGASGRWWLWLARVLLGALLLVIGLRMDSDLGTVFAVAGYVRVVSAVHGVLAVRRRRRA